MARRLTCRSRWAKGELCRRAGSKRPPALPPPREPRATAANASCDWPGLPRGLPPCRRIRRWPKSPRFPIRNRATSPWSSCFPNGPARALWKSSVAAMSGASGPGARWPFICWRAAKSRRSRPRPCRARAPTATGAGNCMPASARSLPPPIPPRLSPWETTSKGGGADVSSRAWPASGRRIRPKKQNVGSHPLPIRIRGMP